MLRPSTWQRKLLVAAAALLLAALLLEAGTRGAEFALQSLDERRTRRRIAEKGACTVLCLGEDMTFVRYPALLETLLNEGGSGVRFTVINQGVLSTHSPDILQHLPAYLDEFMPDIVILMMGVNDTASDKITVPAPKLRFPVLAAAAVRRLRTAAAESPAPAPAVKPAGSWPGLHMARNEGDSATAAFRPGDDFDSLLRQGIIYADRDDPARAEPFFRRCVALNPGSGPAWEELGKLLWIQKRYTDAVLPFERELATGYNTRYAHLYLADICLKTHNFEAALAHMEQLPSLHKFVQFRGTVNDFSAEEQRVLSRALFKNPDNGFSFVHLAELAAARGDRDEETAFLAEAARRVRGNDRLCGAIATLHLVRGRLKESERFFRLAENLRVRSMYRMVYDSYLRSAALVKARGAALVCMQYPMRGLRPLKKMLAGFPGTYYVDNSRSFRDGVAAEGYAAYFVDNFADDFGHCTEKGYQLMAGNAARVILDGPAAGAGRKNLIK